MVEWADEREVRHLRGWVWANVLADLRGLAAGKVPIDTGEISPGGTHGGIRIAPQHVIEYIYASYTEALCAWRGWSYG